ncbi:hypothetical protein E2C01_081699 [Portunus trituberculatus]|uniref:Uncharacterized protein n=1 Tax=Portunus trituberculatus TaxID=210409 RepID=A0A5B7ISK0_PORTR|nr:hypothetical protein [Portunus trituberculatus]
MFPVQALPCILHNVPSNPDLKWTVKACQRLVDLTSRDTHLLLKRVAQTKWLKGTLTLRSDRFRERSDVNGELHGSLCGCQGTAKF